MVDILLYVIFPVYLSTALALLIYGLHCYVMLYLFAKGRRDAAAFRKAVLSRFDRILERGDLPAVTTQIPVYNEYNVVERIVRAACSMAYPSERHEIQILDDSTDETRRLVDDIAAEMAAAGHNIQVLRRHGREGFKAGALAEGFRLAAGELMAVFDADFVPPRDYLLKTVPFFLNQQNLGLVQARWGHLNRDRSLLTRAQSIGIDGHFMVEQSARNWGGLFMNFNGTAGIWRRQAIRDGGGWQWDTLTEDMDLSYRVQMAGWKTLYLPDLVVPAEIPEDVCAFKSQQFRWAKGSIQTALKLLPGLLASPISLFKKVEAWFHLTHYLVHPMMVLLSILALPMLLSARTEMGAMAFCILALMLGFSMAAPSSLYLTSQRIAYPDWKRRIAYLPFLMIIGVGIAVSNCRAVLEALLGQESEFVRTPKKGDRPLKDYRIRLPVSGVLELVLGGYCAVSLGVYLAAGNYLVGPFLCLYAIGFLFIGLLTEVHSLGRFR